MTTCLSVYERIFCCTLLIIFSVKQNKDVPSYKQSYKKELEKEIVPLFKNDNTYYITRISRAVIAYTEDNIDENISVFLLTDTERHTGLLT